MMSGQGRMQLAGMAHLFRHGSGFTLVSLLITVFLFEIALSVAVPLYSMTVKRAAEEELKARLFEYKRAIDRFRAIYHRYPLKLEELVTESPEPRFLRQLYKDPVTGKVDWKLEYDIDGVSIKNVRSSSSEISTEGLPYTAWMVNDSHRLDIAPEFKNKNDESGGRR